MKVRKKRMFIALGILLVIVGALVVWFNIPYSPVKKQFQNDINALLAENQLSVDNELFTEKDFSHLPTTIQQYIANCGYIGTQKMSYMKMEYHNVDFSQGKDRPNLKIDYTQYNFINEPCRLALIDSSMLAIFVASTRIFCLSLSLRLRLSLFYQRIGAVRLTPLSF